MPLHQKWDVCALKNNKNILKKKEKYYTELSYWLALLKTFCTWDAIYSEDPELLFFL